MARPPKVDTVQFRRKLDNPKLQILLSAGQGNISQGFENLLSLYQHLHGIGYRTDVTNNQERIQRLNRAARIN